MPTTVLAALVADHTYPDPYVGMNLRSLPGMGYPIGEMFANLPMPQRLRLIFLRVSELLERFRPEAISVEKLFFNRNVTTALSVGQARGVALLAAANTDLPVFEYTPLEVKQAIRGFLEEEKRRTAIPRPSD